MPFAVLQNLAKLHSHAKTLFNHTQAAGKHHPSALQSGREDQWQKDQVVFDRINELQRAAQHDGQDSKSSRPSRREIMSLQDASNQEAFIEELARS